MPGLYGRGDENVKSSEDRKKEQSQARMQDANASTAPNKKTLAQIRAGH